MPITDALKTAKQLQQAGLTPAVAELLAEKFEETAQATHGSISELIRQEFAALRSELGIQFAQIDGKFVQMEGKFAQIDGKFAQIDGKFAQIDGKFAQMEGKLGELEGKFERSMRMQLVAIIAVISLAVAIIKLFPNWH